MPRQVDLDMIELIDNKLTVDEYLKLRALVGWKKLSREQTSVAFSAEKAIPPGDVASERKVTHLRVKKSR